MTAESTSVRRWYQSKFEEEDDECNLFGNLTPRDDPKGREEIDEALIKMSKKFMKYRLNMFLLQRVSI